MKKLTAIILALVIALSVAVTAFAADATYQCPHCLAVIEGEAAYNKHLSNTCPVVGEDDKNKAEEAAKIQTCPYEGCGAQFKDENEYNTHLDVCLKKTDPTIAQKVEDFILNFKFEDLLGTVEELLGKVNFPDLLVKAIDLLEDAVEGILGAI